MMKYSSVLCSLLAIGTTDSFAPTSRLQQQISVRRNLLQYPTINAIDEPSATTALSSSLTSASSASSLPANETATTDALLSRTQFVVNTSLSTSTSTPSAKPDWVEPLAWRAVIVVLCALWASNFAAAKLVMAEPGVDSSLYALSRFGVAAFSLAPFAIRSVLKGKEIDDGFGTITTTPVMNMETLKESIVCGSWVAFGYLGQTLGLMSTTASKSCVICSMHCVFVAVLAEVWRVQKAAAAAAEDAELLGSAKFDAKRLLPAVVAVIGVAIVELRGAGGSPTVGDALSFAQPIGFGMGYLILENIMARKPEAALPVSAIKLTVVTLASLLMFECSPLLLQGDGSGSSAADFALRLPDFSPILHSTTAMGGILYTGLVTTALALWVESVAFAEIPATDASLILTTEPLFAAACGAVALGETFGASDYVGASLIVGACALSIFMEDPDQWEQHVAAWESDH